MKPINKIKSIYDVEDFGKYYVCIKPLIEDLNCSKHYIEKQTGLDHHTVKQLIDGSLVRSDHKVIARICYCFDCEPQDFCVYVKPKN